MKKILPVAYPPITSFPAVAQALSIVFRDKEKIMPWFIPRYIQLYAFKEKNPKKTYEISANFFDAASDLTYNLKSYVLPRDLINGKWSSFSEFIVDCVDRGYYLNLSMNMYYFPCSHAYQNEHFMHFPMIYGYDDELKTFNVADFYKNLVYSFEEVTYDEMEQAYINTTFDELKGGARFDFWHQVCFWQYREDVDFEFDVKEFISVLEDYLQGRDRTQLFIRTQKYEQTDCHYGINFYDAVIHCLNNEQYDLRPLHLLCDQKKALLMKLEYLAVNKYITEDDYEKINEQCKKLYDLSAQTRNIFIKGNMSEKDCNCVDKIISNLILMKEADRLFFNDLLDSIKRII